MKALIPTSAYRKDVRRTAKRGYDLAKLDAVLKLLQAGDALPPSNRAHPLKGDWKGYWECHLQPDWLLIYKATADEVRLARTGTHADLFGK
jgi:mRNA interferase YafQ